MITLETVAVAIREQATTEIEGEVVILNLANGVYYGLNAVGATVWNMIQAPQTVISVSNRICDIYDVPTDRCRTDMLALLQDMADHGLVELSPVTSS